MKLFVPFLLFAVFVVPFSAHAIASLDGSLDVSVEGRGTSGAEGGAAAQLNVQTSSTVGAEAGQGSVTSELSMTQEAMLQEERDSAEAINLVVAEAESQHEEISSVNVGTDGSIEVKYRHQAKLFGFVPVTVISRTAVFAESDGSVVVDTRLPWWAFLVRGASQIESEIEASVSAHSAVKAQSETRTAVSGEATITGVAFVEAVVSSVVSADTKLKASYDIKKNVK